MTLHYSNTVKIKQMQENIYSKQVVLILTVFICEINSILMSI